MTKHLSLTHFTIPHDLLVNKMGPPCAWALAICSPSGRAHSPDAIPGAAKLPDTIGPSFAATGRGWRHPTSTCRRSAPWKESEMARGPGGPGQPAAMKRQQWWRSCCPSKDCRYDRESSSDGASKREAEEGPGTQERRDAGVERRPVAEGESPPFGCGVDARVTRRTPRRCRRRGYRRWRHAGTSGG